MTPTVLVVQHDDDCPPALVGDWLAAEGVRLDVRRPYAGNDLPATPEEYDGLLVLGGPQGANDDPAHAWLGPTKELVRAAVGSGVPTLGICLGHQLAAVAMGGVVTRNPAGQQVGLVPVGWTDEASRDRLLGPVAERAEDAEVKGIHWNDDVVVDLPDDAVLLATAAGGEVQAARFAPACWGVQWHPEVDHEILRRWAKDDVDRHTERGIDQEAVLREVAAAQADLEETWQVLAASFAALASTRARERTR